MHSVAVRQWGTASFAQLRRRRISKAAISRALASGRLFEVHPGVYSIAPPSLMQFESHLAAAILAGGDGAALCADAAAHWAKLTKHRPKQIHVAVKHRHEPIEGIRWHRLNLTEDERTKLHRMPITALQRIPLDLAPTASVWDLKGVLAELEFHYDIGPEQITLRRGYPGAAKLRKAIEQHTPQLAETRSHLEKAFIVLLENHGVELPSFNAAVGLSTVDATYEDQRLIVELDGVKGHKGERRILRDHTRDLHRRREGFTVLRYHFAQLVTEGHLVAEELLRFGIPLRR
jgi:very-short-patch-repair endonuclease